MISHAIFISRRNFHVRRFLRARINDYLMILLSETVSFAFEIFRFLTAQPKQEIILIINRQGFIEIKEENFKAVS